MAELLVLQHIACETPGRIGDQIASEGMTMRVVHSGEGEPVPRDLEGASGLLVMGGPMGVQEQDRFPFLTEELRLIEKTVAAGKPVLGICLGSQLLAAALDARIFKGPQKEIGWHPVTPAAGAARDALWRNQTGTFPAFHWHGDQFDLPKGAELLASSARTPHQAFRFGEQAYGFLFHMEVTLAMIAEWTNVFSEELRQEGLDGGKIVEESPLLLPELESRGALIFYRWLQKVAAAPVS